MPQASDELRALMGKWFGDEIDDSRPWAFLRSHGFTERRGLIYPPVPAHSLSHEEFHCIKFLIDEWDWDYGPLAEKRAEPQEINIDWGTGRVE